MDKERVKAFVEEKKAAIGGTIVAVGTLTPGLAFAEGETVTGTLTTGVTNAVSGAQDSIIAVLPQALVLMGVVLGIRVGVKLFNRIVR